MRANQAKQRRVRKARRDDIPVPLGGQALAPTPAQVAAPPQVEPPPADTLWFQAPGEPTDLINSRATVCFCAELAQRGLHVHAPVELANNFDKV